MVKKDNYIIETSEYLDNDFQQRKTKKFNYDINNKIQSFINNIAFPKTLDELYHFATNHCMFNVENILFDGITTWTVPNWAKIGDIVFFMHSKTARSTITGLRTKLQKTYDRYSYEYSLLMAWISRGLDLYEKYGGKIFAIGTVIGAPRIIEDEYTSNYHWGSRIYADIELNVLVNPLDISEFNNFITVSRQSAITPVFDQDYEDLISLINNKNSVPDYYLNGEALLMPLSKISKNNWLDITNEYRQHFFLESQFRAYYVDYLLKEIGDIKTIYEECRCEKPGKDPSFVDNIILFNGKYLPVEVKLSINTVKDISTQLSKYTNNNEIYYNPTKSKIFPRKKIYSKNVLVVDTNALYLYDSESNKLNKIFKLDDISKLDDIHRLRNLIYDKLL